MDGWNIGRLICSPDLNEWFAKEWEGIEQVFRLERTVRVLKTGVTSNEGVYGLSSLSLVFPCAKGRHQSCWNWYVTSGPLKIGSTGVAT